LVPQSCGVLRIFSYEFEIQEKLTDIKNPVYPHGKKARRIFPQPFFDQEAGKEQPIVSSLLTLKTERVS